jgi:hypothetical protein
MRRTHSHRAPRARARLAFESLEPRELLAADATAGWSMDWDAATFDDASWNSTDFWTAGDPWGFDDSWVYDDSWAFDDAGTYDDSWVYDDTWGQGDTWVQDVVGDVTAIDTATEDVGVPIDAADTTIIEVVTPPERDVTVAPPVVPFLPPVDVEVPDGVTDEAGGIVVTPPDPIVPEPVFDESIVSAGDVRDDGEIIVCPWLPPASDSEIDDVATADESEPDIAGGIEWEIGGGTTDESWVVDDTAVDAPDLDTHVVVVPPVVPKPDVAVPRVTVQSAPAAGGFRAWGAFFFRGLGQTTGSSDAAAVGLQSPGQPGTGRPRIRLPFRPVV